VPALNAVIVCSKLVNENGEDMQLASNDTAGEGGEVHNNYQRPSGQNVGNFLTDRPSSRVLAAPGGASQIQFGGPPSPSSSGTYSESSAGKYAPSMGNNYSRPAGSQNLGNFITDRSSTKCVAPPGGASSIIFG
jgi:protein SPIRAL1 and related proteins